MHTPETCAALDCATTAGPFHTTAPTTHYVMLTVECDDPERLQDMLSHVREEYGRRMATVYPGRAVVTRAEVAP